MARPTVLNKKTVAKLCKAIALGSTYVMACQFAGVHPRTFERWMRTADNALRDLDERSDVDVEILAKNPDGTSVAKLGPAEDARNRTPTAEKRAATTVTEDLIRGERPPSAAHLPEPKDENGLTDYQRKCIWAWHMVQQAEARCTQNMLQNIQNASNKGEWQAGAWLLERRYPDSFGRKTRVEQTGPGGGPQQVEHAVKVYIPDNGRGDGNQRQISAGPPKQLANQSQVAAAEEAEFIELEADA